jgi:hypothetical protein
VSYSYPLLKVDQFNPLHVHALEPAILLHPQDYKQSLSVSLSLFFSFFSGPTPPLSSLILTMAAQSKQDLISPWGRAAAGATGAVLANALVYPLDM